MRTIEDARIQPLNGRAAVAGDYVLYWMQQSQRAAGNPALEHAIRVANQRGLPLLVGFGLMADYPEASRRHYAFMLQGLAEVERALHARGIGFAIRKGAPDEVALALARKAGVVVCDRGYLRHQKAWRARVAEAAPCLVEQVEGDVVVPVEVASDKPESAARTLRPKLQRVWDDWLRPLDQTRPEHGWRGGIGSEIDLADLETALDGLRLDGSVAPVCRFVGGTGAARERLSDFLEARLDGYAAGRSEPGAFQCSLLSPYLHFGQISPVEIALAVRAAKAGSRDDRGAYLEELIVRRELSMNFVSYTPDYDQYQSLPGWAQATLRAHRDDPRERRYSARQLERAETHDVHWNTAMREMVHTGYMHNYMRMYWAKKILEWSSTPEHAFRTALQLNNRYFLDGRDANSYANVAWTFGLHDRPWPERPVFGKVRSMTAKGLERKFDMKSYRYAVERLVDRENA